MSDVKKIGASTASQHSQPAHSEDLIRERAYEIWQSEGRPSGQHERHWLQAKEELARRQQVDTPKKDDPQPQPTKPERKAKKKLPGNSF